MHRFFIDESDIKDSKALITAEDSHHIQKVLHLRIGEEVVLCDCKGFDYSALIHSMDKGKVLLDIQGQQPSVGEHYTRVSLYQGLPKANKMEVIIQKCVELGIYDFVPVTTSRAVVRLADEREEEKKTIRWQKISEEAAKQSDRGIIPHISKPVSFNDAILDASHSLKLLLWEGERIQSLRGVLQKYIEKPSSIAMMIGPEGGLDIKEVELASNNGWIPVSIGPRILRTETAGISVLSAIMYQMEEMEWKQHP
ncbi:MAG: 16S rRNA (uracil(1498)-N(3))-methyltransferase [Firmicutes bacterium]|nr:16S rRNA (uracil(1498)-N(3))-methyltransferase [Bacillota bacterium]